MKLRAAKAAARSKPVPDIKPYLRAFYEGNRLRWTAAMAFNILSTVNMLFCSWVLGAVIDAAAALDRARLFRLLWICGCFLPFAIVIGLGETRCKTLFFRRAMEQYKSLAFRRLSEKSISAFSQENTGRYLSTLTNDAVTIQTDYLNNSFTVVYSALQFCLALLMMLGYSPLLTLSVVLLSVLPMAVSLLLGQGLTPREKAVSDQNERFVSLVKDLLGGFSVIKSFKAEEEARSLFDESNSLIEEKRMERQWWRGILNIAGGTAGFFMQFGVFFVGAFLALRGSITSGTVLIFVNLCNCILSPISDIPQYLSQRKAARALVEKLAGAVEENTSRSGEPMEPVLQDAISLQNVTFGYDPEKPVLKDVSLTMNAGKKYALVGSSGSGKSTLLNLLMGGYDGYQGSISLDGKELRDIDPDSLYDLMSLMGQNVFLFDDTIRRNITMFRDSPDQQVSSAARRAGLAPLLEEKGENYICGENGGNLSGGERQRVSIARCLLRGTPVLLLDEATAALDNQTAFEVVDSLLKLEGLTRLVVTHRLEKGLLEQYDGIFVLRNGQLCETGTFEDLMSQKGYFYSLYNVTGEN